MKGIICLMVLLVFSFTLLSLSEPANSKELASSQKGTICFYSGLTLIIYSFLSPIRSEEKKVFTDPYTGEEKEEIIHYAHPRWVELALGLVLHRIGSNLIVTANGIAYEVKF